MTTFIAPDDLLRYKGQKRAILSELGSQIGYWYNVEALEAYTGSKRVASRINELRDDWLIETRKNPATKRAMYRLVGKRTQPRQKKPHCETCRCGQQCMVTVSGHGNTWQCSKDEGHAGVHKPLEQVPLEQARLLL